MTPEKVVQDSIIKYLKNLQKQDHQVYVERRQAGGFSYKMGIGDLYATFSGYHVEIEVKKPGGIMSPLQERWRDKCKVLDIGWICADSVEDVKRYIENTFNIMYENKVYVYKKKRL